uniref:Secreted protein n=1 Tax=Anopheles darlingi TaxID=43151 RepID=A0A2M4DS89_ANODA
MLRCCLSLSLSLISSSSSLEHFSTWRAFRLVGCMTRLTPATSTTALLTTPISTSSTFTPSTWSTRTSSVHVTSVVSAITVVIISSAISLPVTVAAIALAAPSLSVAFWSTWSTTTSSHATGWGASHTTPPAHRAHRTHVVWLGSSLLYIYFLSGDGLFRSFQQFVHNLLGVERDEAKPFTLIFLLVERHLYLYNVAKLTEKYFDFLIAYFRREATNKNFPVASLRLLRVDFFVVDDMIPGRYDLLDGIGVLVDDKGEASRPACVGIRLHIDAFYIAVSTEVFFKILCHRRAHFGYCYCCFRWYLRWLWRKYLRLWLRYFDQ